MKKLEKQTPLDSENADCEEDFEEKINNAIEVFDEEGIKGRESQLSYQGKK